jgi:pyruvate dehydrogenase E2 component (dihydrolipoamide acetyltransferase)
MATPVEMPKLGNTVEECLIVTWLKHKGDTISDGEVIAEIETDKTTFELKAPSAGTMLDVFFDEGALVPVFTNLCVIGEAGESVEAFKAQPSTQERVAPSASDPMPAVSARTRPGDHPSTPGPDATPSTAAGADTASGIFSPRARRFAAEHNFHPRSVVGSGPGGRVLEDDLRRLYHATPRVSSVAQRQIESGSEPRRNGTGLGGMIRAADLGPPAERISGIREKIARRMRESLAVSAQYTLHASATATGLLALRRTIKGSAALPDITINDLVVFCTIKALLQMPELNAEFIDGKLYRHADINMGFACDTDRGLVVPVVKESQTLSLVELSLRLKELATQAVQNRIGVDDLSGATFTISNLGGLGIESFTPLLNPPQVAILGVGAIVLKPVRTQGGTVEFIDAIGLSLTCDHQVIDGAPGARFLQVLGEKIENVELLCSI